MDRTLKKQTRFVGTPYKLCKAVDRSKSLDRSQLSAQTPGLGHVTRQVGRWVASCLLVLTSLVRLLV